MKKPTTILLILLAIATIAYAGASRFKIVSATGVITSSEGFLTKVIISSDRATTGTWNLYDYGGVSGGFTTTEQELIPTYVVSTSESGGFYHEIDLPRTQFREGLYATISSTGEMAVYYEQ